MADYDFYVNVYLGSQIPEKAFPTLAAQAAGTLAEYDRKYRVSGAETSRNMAICAMAEVLREQEKYSRHSSASLGSARVQYVQPRESLGRRLYRAANIYLDIYRGVQ